MELQNTVLSGSLLIAAVVAVVAGLISFFSPCSLPLLPGYLSYVAGVSGQESAVARELGGGAVAGRRRTLSGAGLFVLGFAAVFTSYGALFGALGSQLVRHQDLIIRASGALTVLLGLVFATSGSLVPVLGRTIRIDYQPGSVWAVHLCWELSSESAGRRASVPRWLPSLRWQPVQQLPVAVPRWPSPTASALAFPSCSRPSR